MKNKKFLALSQEKRQKILIGALRSKTKGLLRMNEEVALLSALERKKQFRICVCNDVNEFGSALSAVTDYETIYGAEALALLKRDNALIETGIAVFIPMQSENASEKNGDRLLLYVPESRHCKHQCLREKVICENLETSDSESLCCGLQRVLA